MILGRVDFHRVQPAKRDRSANMFREKAVDRCLEEEDASPVGGDFDFMGYFSGGVGVGRSSYWGRRWISRVRRGAWSLDNPLHSVIFCPAWRA